MSGQHEFDDAARCGRRRSGVGCNCKAEAWSRFRVRKTDGDERQQALESRPAMPLLPANPDPDALRPRLEEFIRYRDEYLRGDERGEAQVFLERLFRAFGHEGVFEAGATLEERVARRDDGGTAFADLVWKPRVLIEMKRAGQNLARHYRQAFEYWIDLVPDRPAYVVLCNFDHFWIYDFNRQLDEPVERIELPGLVRQWEGLAFLLPREEQPVFTNDLVAVTRESAARVSRVFNELVERGTERAAAQRFILQALMALFAEDIGLLPRHFFTQAVEDCLEGASAYDLVFGLFREMNAPGLTPGGRFAGTPYFNGGLFSEIVPFDLERPELELLHDACVEDWAAVRPAIFGTLFEQSLEMDERHAYGAHFTSEADIQKIVLPTIVRPWRERIDGAATLEELAAVEEELLSFRVLDPACGCGNFLYVAYRELRRIERRLVDRIRHRRRRPGVEDELRMTFLSTRQFFGMDINAFATEVAKVTLMLARKLAADELGDERAVLPLDDLDPNFVAADALTVDWPQFDTCIGNPPYLGRQRLIEERGAAYAARLDDAFPDVGGFADYVVYFFRRAHDLLPDGARAGLVGTNTIRQGATRRASLDYITANDGVIYDAVSSQPWSGDAVVNVSIVNWAKGIDPSPKTLWLSDGTVKLEVESISGSLSAEVDVSSAAQLGVNRRPKVCFQGQTPGQTEGFVLTVDQAERLLAEEPGYSAVVHPFLTGEELNSTGIPGRYVIDVPDDDLARAERWPRVMDRLRLQVLPTRRAMAEREEARNLEVLAENPRARPNRHHQNFYSRWWQLGYRRADMIDAIAELPRYIALSRVAIVDRPSIYAFVSPEIRPGDSLQVFAFSDDYSFAVLTSNLHRRWFEERCSTMRRDLRYTPNTVFDSFPWPQAPREQDVARVVDAAVELINHRDELVAEGVSLGRQYASLRDPGANRLRDLHSELDVRVFELYGFSEADDPLAQLLALNESIAVEEQQRITRPRGPGNLGLPGTERTVSMIRSPE